MFEKPQERRAEKEQLSFGEILFGGLLLAAGAKAYYDRRKEDIDKVLDEAADDLKAQPTMLKEVFGSTVTSLGSLVMEDMLKYQKQRIHIRQKCINNINKFAKQEDELDILQDVEVVQKEAMSNVLERESAPHERISYLPKENSKVVELFEQDLSGYTEEEKIKLFTEAVIADEKTQAEKYGEDYHK